MTYPIWPDSISAVLVQGYGNQVVSTRQISNFDSGTPSVRRRYSKAAHSVGMQMLLTLDQKYFFERYWRDTLREGTQFFWFPNPETNGAPLLTHDGLPVLTDFGAPVLMKHYWLCLMGESEPTFTTVGGIHFGCSFSLMVMPL